MNAVSRLGLLSVVVGASLLALVPASTDADDYWNSYWGWYDNTYRPYYTQRYYASPGYGYATGPAYSTYVPAISTYGPGYYGPSYAPGYYGNAPYGTYYGTPRAGVGVYPGSTAVRVGPMRFGWR